MNFTVFSFSEMEMTESERKKTPGGPYEREGKRFTPSPLSKPIVHVSNQRLCHTYSNSESFISRFLFDLHLALLVDTSSSPYLPCDFLVS